MLQKKFSTSSIAGTIGVSVSTVCRERKRNSDSKGVYDGHPATVPFPLMCAAGSSSSSARSSGPRRKDPGYRYRTACPSTRGLPRPTARLWATGRWIPLWARTARERLSPWWKGRAASCSWRSSTRASRPSRRPMPS